MHRIGVWLPNWIGDVCMATPALRALRSSFGQGVELVGVMRPVVNELLSGANWFDRMVLFDKRASVGVKSRRGVVSALRSARIDTMLLLPNSLWTALASRIAGIRRIVGYDRDCRGWLLSDRVSVPRDGRRLKPISAIDYYLELASWLGCDAVSRSTELTVTPHEVRLADQLWAKIGFDALCPTVVINNSGATAPAKLWPADSINALARRIVENHDWQVLLHCGPAELQASQTSAASISHPRVRSMGEADSLPIGLSKSVLSRAALVISTDSGPRHMSVALAPKVISLFGSTDSVWTTTYNGNELTVEASLGCRPCWQKTCPLQHTDCMRLVSVDQVYAQVVEHMPNCPLVSRLDQLGCQGSPGISGYYWPDTELRLS